MSPGTQEAIAAVIKKMKDVGDLPVMTATIREVTDLEKEETSSAADLANVILKDLALTTKVLKLANSVYYNWSQKEISTISRAVVVLGFKTITNMAVGVRVLDYFYRSPKSKYLRAHLLVTMFAALFSRILAKRLNYADGEEVFILTLLNNIGLLMTAYALPEQFEKIKSEIHFLQVIRATSPLDHKSIWLEIFPKGVSKGHAANRLCNFLQIKRHNTIGIGNDYNDIDLLDWTARSFAVANSPKELKQKYETVKSNEEDGFAEVAEKILNDNAKTDSHE